jgi:hypothetical protein
MSTILAGRRRGSRAGRSAVSALAVTGLAAAGLLAAAGPALAQDTPSCGAPVVSGGTATVTCAYTGAAQSWTVPGGVTQATFTLYGANGGAGAYGASGSGGLGAEVSAAVPVTGGTVLQVNVGQAGSSWGGGTFGGGGAANFAGGSGGGASDVISPSSGGSYPFGSVLLVAGGGGGGSPLANPAHANPPAPFAPAATGGPAGSPGQTGSTDPGGSNSTLGGGGGGGAGSATAGGSGGAKGSLTGSGLCQGDPGEAGKSGTAGSQGAGGSGGLYGGGGGGGGYYGGGGGGGAAEDGCSDSGGPGGGGGGSSYTGGVSGAIVQDGVAAPSGAPDGEVIISYSYVAPSIITSSLPGAAVGSAYSQDLSASGGAAPYSWSVTGGSLPGLSLASDGTLSGTPTSVGTFRFGVQVTDSSNPAQKAVMALSLTVGPAALAVSASSLPGGTSGSAYSQDLSASGGTNPYSWSVTSGSLPAGLSLARNGAISGTPTVAGTSTFTVQVKDAGNPAQTATQQFTLTVGPAAGGGTSCQTTATSFISADCYDASQGPIDVTAATGDSNPSGVDGNQAPQLANGDYLEYNNINFGSGSTQFDAQVASGAAGGVSGLVEVVLDNPDNTPVGSFAVASTGGWNSWKMIPANISTVTGVHNVYLEFVSGATGNPAYVSLHYFDFPVS